MSEIGIITFHTPNNFGAVLQSYALQKYLEINTKCNVEIIDYHTAEHDKDNRILRKFSGSIVTRIVCLISNLYRYRLLKKRKKKFEQFRVDYLNLSSRYSSLDEIEVAGKNYDVVISGSDQVFNPGVKDSSVYYLSKGFENTRKVAYAPSFGISDYKQLTNNHIKWLKSFSYLSCREINGADYLSQLMGTIIPCVADPTFLLGKDEWSKIAINPIVKNNYIFVYELNAANNVIKIAKAIAKYTGHKIICSTTRTPLLSFGYEKHYDLGPREILGYIQNASYVVTDSFHGTALSLIMDTRVIPYIALSSTSSRVESLMKRLGLQNNIVGDVNEFSWEKLHFSNYSDKLKSYIEESKHFLHMSLNLSL